MSTHAPRPDPAASADIVPIDDWHWHTLAVYLAHGDELEMAARLSGLTTAEAEAILAEPDFQALLRRCKASAALSLEERHDRLVRMARALIAGISGRA